MRSLGVLRPVLFVRGVEMRPAEQRRLALADLVDVQGVPPGGSPWKCMRDGDTARRRREHHHADILALRVLQANVVICALTVSAAAARIAAADRKRCGSWSSCR